MTIMTESYSGKHAVAAGFALHRRPAKTGAKRVLIPTAEKQADAGRWAQAGRIICRSLCKITAIPGIARSKRSARTWRSLVQTAPDRHLSLAPTLYRSAADAAAPVEKLAYVALLAPDALAVVDVDPTSSTHSSVVGQWNAPVHEVPDEFHHYGWNICSAALGPDHVHDGPMERRYDGSWHV